MDLGHYVEDHTHAQLYTGAWLDCLQHSCSAAGHYSLMYHADNKDDRKK